MAKPGTSAGKMAKGKPKLRKGETSDRNVQAIINILRRNPAVLKDIGVERAFRKLERSWDKTERAAIGYKRASLLYAADSFAHLIEIRTVNKGEITPVEIALFQQWFNQWFSQFRDNFPEFLRMVADILERKPLPPSASPYGDKIEAAYHEAMKRCNTWFFEAMEDSSRLSPSEHADNVRKFMDTGVTPSFSEFEKVFREQNPQFKVSGRSLRRSLERLGNHVRSDSPGRRKEK
jgi:hypothetical protein